MTAHPSRTGIFKTIGFYNISLYRLFEVICRESDMEFNALGITILKNQDDLSQQLQVNRMSLNGIDA